MVVILLVLLEELFYATGLFYLLDAVQIYLSEDLLLVRVNKVYSYGLCLVLALERYPQAFVILLLTLDGDIHLLQFYKIFYLALF